MQKIIIHFQKADPVLAPLVAAAFKSPKSIALRPAAKPKLYFQELAETIVSQQLSVKAADTIWNRFVTLAGSVTPEALSKLTFEQLRGVGLSGQKAGYIQGLARDILTGNVNLDKIHELDDEAVIAELIKLKGIGRWSAEMFLMFTLGRPDVFSLGDLGLVTSIEQHYGKLTQAKLDKLVASWSPYRTWAALALWHSRDNKPQP